jgi:NosR/NirI family nitrous oxide reductase transcriptional regulator
VVRIFVCTLALATAVVVAEQASTDPELQAQLRELFPSASGFSPRAGSPPHFKAYAGDVASRTPTVMGYAFWTTDLEPLERGYDGPIKVLAGVDTKGMITGIIVVDHHEPYGYFSIDPPQYAAQFKQKNIRDPFRVGGDIDAISTATLTVTSATRAIRNGARRIARQFLTPPGATTPR